jgi:6-phosphogluconolactonase
VDERAVDLSHEASNAKLVQNSLLVNKAETAIFEPLFNGDAAESSAAAMNQALKPIDVVVLGMGDDGHFASLFPANHPVAGLADDLNGFVATDSVGFPHIPRISMTLNYILSASLVVLLVSSETKRDKVKQGLASVDPLNPISYLLNSLHLITIEWPDGEVATVQNGVLQ